MVWSSVVFESGGLFHIYYFFKSSMKESIFHIQLLKWSFSNCCLGKNHVDSSSFNNGTKCVLKVESFNLIIPFGDKTSFMLIDCSINRQISLEHPFLTNSIHVRFTRYKSSCSIHMQSLNILFYSFYPVRLTKSVLEIFRFTNVQ